MISGLSIAKMSFDRNRIYLLNHLVNNIGSFVFGYIYVSIWQALLGNSDEAIKMTTYIMVNQASLWVVMFVGRGSYIPPKVRKGTIAFDLLKPFSLVYISFFEFIGHITYNFFFRSIPIFIFGIILLKAKLPEVSLIAPYFLTLINGVIISFFLNYFVGLWSMKHYDYSGAQMLYFFTMNLLGGFFLPAEYLPGIMSRIMPYLPFASTIYLPSKVYLGEIHLLKAASIQIFWIITFLILAKHFTKKLTKSVVIQGG